jgi:hypothetical protein
MIDTEWQAFGTTEQDYTLTVDQAIGDDDNIGDSGNPLKTIDEAIRRVPPHIRHNVEVHVLSGTYDWLYLSGKHVETPGFLYIHGDSQLAAGLTGLNTGTATGGTTTKLIDSGAGWAVDELVGKSWEITAGTHTWYSGRIMENDATSFTINGKLPTAFDATDVYQITESTVTIKEPTDTYNYPYPLTVQDCSGSIFIMNLDFEVNDNKYQRYAGRVRNYGWGGLFVMDCSFKCSAGAVAAGAFSQYSMWIQNCLDVQFYRCAFLIPNAISGIWSGIYLYGPNGKIGISGSVMNDLVECYYGIQHLTIGGCTRYLRSNAMLGDVYRTVNYFNFSSNVWDAKGVSANMRFDGLSNLDFRGNIIENAAGHNIYTYGHHGDILNLYLRDTELNGASGDGVNIGGNSVVTLVNAKTDAGNKNTGWGLRLRNGSKAVYTGTNTLTGVKGDVNLGDDVTAVLHGVTQTDTTHLTRIAAMGA